MWTTAEVRMVWSVAVKLRKCVTAKKAGQILETEIGKELEFSYEFLTE